MTSVNQQQICGLGMFANEASKAGYTNPNGTVNLNEAQYVCQKFGTLIPKDQLDAQTLEELNQASKKIAEKYNLNNDTFQKNS